jgi:hypothetical protein
MMIENMFMYTTHRNSQSPVLAALAEAHLLLGTAGGPWTKLDVERREWRAKSSKKVAPRLLGLEPQDDLREERPRSAQT